MSVCVIAPSDLHVEGFSELPFAKVSLPTILSLRVEAYNVVVTTTAGTISLKIDPHSECCEVFGLNVSVDDNDACDPSTIRNGIVDGINFFDAEIEDVTMYKDEWKFCPRCRRFGYEQRMTLVDNRWFCDECYGDKTVTFVVVISAVVDNVVKRLVLRAYNCHNGFYPHNVEAINFGERQKLWL